MITDNQLDLWGKHLLEKLEKGDEQERLYLQFAKELKGRLDKNKDAIICVSGERGLGKSSFSVNTCLLLRQLGVKFTTSHIFYGETERDSAINTYRSSQFSAFSFDEMIDFAYSRDAMTRQSKMLIKTLTKSRKLNNITFLNIPRFRALDPGIRNEVVHFWCDIVWRSDAEDRDKQFALVALLSKDRNPITTDPWGLDDSRLMKKRIYDAGNHLKFLKKLRSFVCVMRFPPLPKVLEDYYESLSIKSLMAEQNDIQKISP